jgi:hypothetical protein
MQTLFKPTVHVYLTVALLASAASTLTACIDANADEWGEDEPVYDGKQDGSSLMTIYLPDLSTHTRKILATEQLGELERDRTGILNVDGHDFNDNTVLIFSGELHRYDGKVEPQLFVVKPENLPKQVKTKFGTSYLRADLKADSGKQYAAGASRLGSIAGVFRGEIIATDKLSVGTKPNADLKKYYVKPSNPNERPPNVLRKTTFYIDPNISLTKLLPKSTNADPCLGNTMIDNTNVGTLLGAFAVDGFPTDKPVQIEMHYLYPRGTAATVWGTWWSALTGSFAGNTVDDVVVKGTLAAGKITGELGEVKLRSPALNTQVYAMAIELRARIDDTLPAIATFRHQLTVAAPNADIIVDTVELCPIDDASCHDFRDNGVPENVVARRDQIEREALAANLYQPTIAPISSCASDKVGGTACSIYSERKDSAIERNVKAGATFSVAVDGNASVSGAWTGPKIAGLDTPKLEAAFQGAFNLDADFSATFQSTAKWTNRKKLDVYYDPTKTQIQWWRIAHPKLRYIQIARVNACGDYLNAHKAFLADTRDSRIVLSCEAVPANRQCNAVEPTPANVDSCATLLINPASEAGQACQM